MKLKSAGKREGKGKTDKMREKEMRRKEKAENEVDRGDRWIRKLNTGRDKGEKKGKREIKRK